MIQLIAILLCIIITNQVRQLWQSSGKDFGAHRVPDVLGLWAIWLVVLDWGF